MRTILATHGLMIIVLATVCLLAYTDQPGAWANPAPYLALLALGAGIGFAMIVAAARP